MNRIRFRRGVIDQMKQDRHFNSDTQAAAALGLAGVDDLERLRHGAPITTELAARFAAVQGTGYDLSQWVEPWTPEKVAS
ncbi:hypothetical protein [Gordonia sp. (in: high G+C Gram-positive bacteria)]|uniref:hypothetical protein n=1 Tax=Gordonia sp. (in: high G+C Gram-positive bacteria) TaxID=84139 RepID=UPI00262C9158|nr:hypothetical protein [Gordonia sp. (in: high G+C Gram-positive bacteria)]